MVTDRRRYAFHEAGHLTVAYILMRGNAEIGGALIFDNEIEGSAGATFVMPRGKIGEKILNTYHLAGIFAEALALNDGNPVSVWPDEESDLCRRAEGDMRGLDPGAMECSGRFAESFLRSCWPFVCAVAGRIERNGLIVARELHALYRRFYLKNERDPSNRAC